MVQSQTYTECIDGLKEHEFVTHVDYSKNYKNKHQNKIKSAFYSQDQFMIYTACIYTFCKKAKGAVCTSFALITLENDHSCNVSFALNNFLIKEMEKRTEIKKIKFWSYGCASQYKS